MKLYGDVETTGINPYCSEIITGYFELYDDDKLVDSFDLRSQVNFWSDEAEKIHRIPRDTMLSYPRKKVAWEEFCNWLPKSFIFSCYANPNSEMGVVVFDKAIIQNELMLTFNAYKPSQIPFNPERLDNIYEKAVWAESMRFFTALRGKSGRKSFKQINVHRALFGTGYNSHVAQDDVKAMVRIDQKLESMKQQNKDILEMGGFYGF